MNLMPVLQPFTTALMEELVASLGQQHVPLGAVLTGLFPDSRRGG